MTRQIAQKPIETEERKASLTCNYVKQSGKKGHAANKNRENSLVRGAGGTKENIDPRASTGTLNNYKTTATRQFRSDEKERSAYKKRRYKGDRRGKNG